MSDEARARMSAAHVGRTLSAAHRAKIGAALKGRTRSPKPPPADARSKVRSMPLEELCEAIVESYGGRAEHETLAGVRWLFQVLKEELHFRKSDELEHDDTARAFLDYLVARSDLVDRTRITRFSQYKAMCRRAYRLGLIAALPDFPPYVNVRELPMGTRTLPPSRREAMQLLAHLESQSTDWEGRRLFAMAALAAYAAMPTAEMFRLRTRDIDLAGGVIWVRRRWGGSEQTKAVPIPEDLRPILAGWRRRTGSELAFPNRDRTGPWIENDALKQLQAAARAAGIRGGRMTFERLRRYCLENVVSRPGAGGKLRHRRRLNPTEWGRVKPSVEIKPDGHASVNGEDKGILSTPQRQAVSALLAAGPRGLSKEGMNQQCDGRPGWRQVLMRLRRDSDWADAIEFPGGGYPGKESGLYRVLPERRGSRG
jgi:integrase